jgi:hypothetical protein
VRRFTLFTNVEERAVITLERRYHHKSQVCCMLQGWMISGYCFGLECNSADLSEWDAWWT